VIPKEAYHKDLWDQVTSKRNI